ncbi:MAG: Ig domain-containing protein, partial [Mangrovicoccus sp.]|nr:Ig domain-containing protein [Mangrovicoccus sp.]
MVTIAAEETGNQPPVIAPLGDLEVTETDEVTVPISASDANGDDTITLSALIIRPNSQPVNPDTYALTDFGDGTGELVWKTPSRADDGVYDIIITAEDGVNPAVTEQFTITVRDTSAAMPVIASLPDLTVDETDEVVVPISASDADGNDTITLSALIIRPNGQPVKSEAYTLTDFGDGTGELVWKTPTRAEDGVYDIIITAEDGVTPAVTEQFTITVIDTDLPPPDPDQKLLGTRFDDDLIGGSGDDTILLRFGNDRATGNDGADQFIIDGRYLWQGDTHEITDLDFSQGDQLVLRAMSGGNHVITNQSALEAFIAQEDVTAEPTSQGMLLSFSSQDGVPVNLLLHGDQPPEEPDPTDPPLKLLGSRADDTLAGGNGDDTLMLRFGNDSATGNDGADQFILDGRYLWQGDAHEITDLDFSEGDQLVLRKLPGVPIISTKLTSMNALERAIANSDITATQTEIGLELLLQDDSGDQATLLLRGFQLDDLA